MIGRICIKGASRLGVKIMSKTNYNYQITELPINKLIPLPNNPFELYEGQRLEDLVESIQSNGVLVPIIVCPVNNGLYEILAGHNRVEALKIIGSATVPAIIRDGLTDIEAMFIAIETNLIQRSFSDFSFSERAATIAMHYDGIKDQGRRTDLVEEVEMMLSTGNAVQSATSGQVGQKLGARVKAGKEYGLSGTNVARYLRINNLIPEFKKRLNTGAISFIAAVNLSYLSIEEQGLVYEVLASSRHKLSISESEELRKVKKPLTRDDVYQIVEDETAREAAPYKISKSIITQYFKSEQKRDEIEEIISKALEMYYGKI